MERSTYRRFRSAIMKDDVLAVKQLIAEGFHVNSTDMDGETPLRDAATFSKNPKVLEVLIEAGADVNRQGVIDSLPLTPLHCAIRYNTPDIVKVLIKAGVDVNTKDKDYGYTPLHELALRTQRTAITSSDATEIANALIGAGADPDIPSANGDTFKSMMKSSNLPYEVPLRESAQDFCSNP